MDGRQRYVHRWIYSLLHGGFRGIEGMAIIHLCDNSRCYRYDHLWGGTVGDNNRDRSVKGRSARGEGTPKAKLTEVQVQEIRRRRSTGETLMSLSSAFGVAPTTIRRVVERETWIHI